ncbi:GntR family transcriptional regulator [Methylobacterium persicinum]|uniref:DNA-binding GntR family transcriptional regulator n=1 Tax=Methylobacterium persicinum TaxID=374426 RepID=A0ABU0HLF8_9HYPH|nr:GntR family transcriptional regulator [Methylobacterium persicinum]MDQ0442361.1 DNA-binding GntR family transcriptional regulator [Methylobacterium persicinum]GJE37180.1 HTH-type transcriptional repressor RspR [Methylobacterium persicinum]
MRNLEAERSSATGAYERLLRAIEEGEIPPGSRLREAELAERFAMSRTPVREALGRLETQGLVVHEPHRGASVAQLDYGQVSELYDLREVLEGTAARLAAIYASEVEVEVLEEMVARDRPHVGDAILLARTNRQFHRQIHACARNRFLQGMLETMRLSLVLLPGTTTLAAPERAREALDEHQRIVAGIRAHDGDAAEAAARGHIRAAFKARIMMLQEV